jgi:hypothetical protein
VDDPPATIVAQVFIVMAFQMGGMIERCSSDPSVMNDKGVRFILPSNTFESVQNIRSTLEDI